MAPPSIGRRLVDIRHPNRWSVLIDDSSAQSDVVVRAAPGAGQHLVITDIAISSLTAQTTRLLDGDDTPVYPTVYTDANGNHVNNLLSGISLVSNKALHVTSTASIAHSIHISGYTEVD